MLAIGVSFLCSILESVLLSTTPTYVEKLKSLRPKKAARIDKVRINLDESLAAILILNTFAHTMGAAGVGSQAIQLFGNEWEILIAVLLTLAILYFSEIIPKTLGAIFWRKLAFPAAIAITWLTRIVYPLVWLSTRLTKLFSRNESNNVTREEIIALASLGNQDGVIYNQENEYLSNLLTLRDINVDQILTPRSVVHMLAGTITVKEALDNQKTGQFTRIPIYQNHIDNISNMVILADLFEAERSGLGDQPISEFAKPISRVSEKLSVQQLLDMFIKQKAY